MRIYMKVRCMPMIKGGSVYSICQGLSEVFCKQGQVFIFLWLPMCLLSQTLMRPSAQYFAHKDCKLIGGQVHDG